MATGRGSSAPNLAWRIERQTRLIELDPTHAGQAWPALAWTIKAWESAGGDGAELINELAEGRTLTDLALEAGHELTWHQRLQAIEHTPHPLPWAATPNTLHHSDAVPAELRDYLDHVADTIRTRVDHLTDHAIAERPTWTETFGETPTDEATFERWRTAIALAAAHRDQLRVETDDPAHPFGPYLEAGRAGHHSWWAAASATLVIDNPEVADARTGLAETANEQLTITIARGTYAALPTAEREVIHDLIAPAWGPNWELASRDPSVAMSQIGMATDLIHALSSRGLLTPEFAADLKIANPYPGIDPNAAVTQSALSHHLIGNAPEPELMPRPTSPTVSHGR